MEPIEFVSDEYNRLGEKYSLENGTRANSFVRQIFKQRGNSTRKRARRDEPELGALVYIDSLDTLKKYISGSPRRPFHNPAGNFVIVLTTPVQPDWDALASQIMANLWQAYGILHAFFITACDRNEVSARKLYAQRYQLTIGQNFS